MLIPGKYQKTITKCDNVCSKVGILPGYHHELGCQDSKVLDRANQLHTFQNSEDSTTGIVEVLLFENHSSVLLTTLRRRVSIISFMKYM